MNKKTFLYRRPERRDKTRPAGSRIVALLTDFGFDDNFVGVMKGVILSINPRVDMVDISHGIAPQDISGAALLLKGSYKYFPRRSVFLVVVDPGVGSERKPIVVRSKNYFFVGPDNGVLSPAAREDGIKTVVQIENRRYFLEPVSETFHGRDIFAPVAAHLSRNARPGIFGRTLTSMAKLDMSRPGINRNVMKGEVIYIDRFGNLVTNIDRDSFLRFAGDGRIKIRIKGREITSIAASYQAVKPGDLLAVFGSFDLLEISVNMDSAEKNLKAGRGTAVSVVR